MQAGIMYPAPQTPTRTRFDHGGSFQAFQPSHSSPLASSIPSSPTSSPGIDAHARRREQFKSQAFSTPSASRTPHRRMTPHSELAPLKFGEVVPTEEAPRKAFLRERFRTRCLERAQKDRESRVRRKRISRSEASSDGDDEVMDEDDEDYEALLNDELFCRMVSSNKRKQQHEYRLSYAHDIGSSFDPDMEDIDEWEKDLDPPQPISTFSEDLEDEELAAYAADYELHLEELSPDNIFSLSDWDPSDDEFQQSVEGKGRALPATIDNEDVEMTV